MVLMQCVQSVGEPSKVVIVARIYPTTCSLTRVPDHTHVLTAPTVPPRRSLSGVMWSANTAKRERGLVFRPLLRNFCFLTLEQARCHLRSLHILLHINITLFIYGISSDCCIVITFFIYGISSDCCRIAIPLVTIILSLYFVCRIVYKVLYT